MAEGGSRMASAKFSCSICQDLLKDPVTIPCGHSYCTNCINRHWDQEMEHPNMELCSCPLCREMFASRPKLKKNIMLAELVEDVKKIEDAAVNFCYAGPKDVACDICTGRKLKSKMSCLVCLVSYCEQHLHLHHECQAFNERKRLETPKRLRENTCSRHNKVMDFFCRTDQQSICFLCDMDQHRDHDTVLAAAERNEQQGKLEASRQSIRQKLAERERDKGLLQLQIEAINVSTDEAVEHSMKSFSQMIHLIQRKNAEEMLYLRLQQEAAVSGVREHQERLQQEMAELMRKDLQLKELANTRDHNQFLHSYPSVSALSEPPHPSIIPTPPVRYFEDVAAAVSESTETLQAILRETDVNISPRVTEEQLILQQPQPETRAYFFQYSKQITLDPNTAHNLLLLSDRNRMVTYTEEDQLRPHHPDRFTEDIQVLSRESLTGRCYWEVEWRGRVDVAVTYKDVGRAGRYIDCQFGYNDKSWALRCHPDHFTFLHNNTETPIAGPHSSRVGVFLHPSAGVLAFYSVSKVMTLIHRVHATFTEPLHAGVLLFFRASANFVYFQ